MTDNDAAPPEPTAQKTTSPEDTGTSQGAGEPGYLTETGEAVGEDGTVVPIIGGLPAAEGSAWDIGAPLDERGAGLADQHLHPADPDGPQSSAT